MYPVRISENGRYFVDQEGTPVFWLGTTQWQLFRGYSLEEADLILEKTARTGFAFVQVMLLGSGVPTQPNSAGDTPWFDENALRPNEAYFRSVDQVIEAARRRNVVISMTIYHRHYLGHITLEKARSWARWVAARYRDVPNIVWSMTPEVVPYFVPVLRELAAGLREGDAGSHLITAKPDPGPFSSSFIHTEPWLDFNSIQTFAWPHLIYPLVNTDYHLDPVKPVLMAEGAYEQGPEYGLDVTPLWVRRQAYYSYLAGAHHTYGHNDSWRVLPTWREALDAPGAAQLGLLKQIFEERAEWWYLVPDQSLLTEGGQIEGRILNLAARHGDGKWALVYSAAPASFSVALGKLVGREARALWIDPRTAEQLPIGRVPTSGERSFSTPVGWEDALLVVETTG
jgi:hypothetical protein